MISPEGVDQQQNKYTELKPLQWILSVNLGFTQIYIYKICVYWLFVDIA